MDNIGNENLFKGVTIIVNYVNDLTIKRGQYLLTNVKKELACEFLLKDIIELWIFGFNLWNGLMISYSIRKCFTCSNQTQRSPIRCVWEKVIEGFVDLMYIKVEDQTTYFLTNALPKYRYIKSPKKL